MSSHRKMWMTAQARSSRGVDKGVVFGIVSSFGPVEDEPGLWMVAKSGAVALLLLGLRDKSPKASCNRRAMKAFEVRARAQRAPVRNVFQRAITS
jgi:hypothetical protein